MNLFPEGVLTLWYPFGDFTRIFSTAGRRVRERGGRGQRITAGETAAVGPLGKGKGR